MSDVWRGHAIEEIAGGVWVYSDTGEPVRLNTDRPCGHCGLANTLEGHDGCLGTLPGVMNACCGHGDDDSAYVQYWDGRTVRGAAAIRLFGGRGL